jgi:hypothetical protein
VTSLRLLLLALLLPASVGAAAPAEPAREPPATETEEAPDREEAPPEPAPERGDERNARQDSPDVFVPTEQVSEDLSVSFPVDI